MVRPMMLDLVVPVAAEMVEAEAVGFQIDDVQQARFEGDELGGIHFALEDRGLDALAVVETGFGGAPQAGFAGGRDAGIVVGEEMGKDGEVAGGGIPLDASQGVEAGGAGNETDADGEEIGGVGEGEGAFRGFLAVIAGGAHEDVAGVGELGGDHVGGDGEGGGLVVGAAVLFAAQQDVSGGEAVGGSEEFPVRIVK